MIRPFQNAINGHRKMWLFSVIGIGLLLLPACGEKEMIEASKKELEEKIITPPYLPTDYSSFRNFSVNDGLPENTANSMLVDRSGYLWVGTQSGLAKFENNQFQAYYYTENDERSVYPKWNQVYLDHEGRVCSRSPLGIAIYDEISDNFRRVKNPEGDTTMLQSTRLDAKENLWLIQPYDGGCKIKMYSHTDLKIEEDFPRALMGHFIQTEDGTLYAMMDFIHRRELIHLSGGNKGINTTPLVIDGSYQWTNNVMFFFGDNDLVLNEDEFISWFGEGKFFRTDGSLTEELELNIPRQEQIIDLKFYTDLSENHRYLIAQFADISFELYRFNETNDSVNICGHYQGHASNAAVNSRGDVTFVVNNIYPTPLEETIGNYVRQDDTTYLIPSNISNLTLGQNYSIRSAIYDEVDNLWLGSMNLGVNMFSPVDQGFRKNVPDFIKDEEKNMIYYPIYSSGDTNVIINNNGKIFPGLGREPIELSSSKKIEVWAYRQFENKVLIAAGKAGVMIYDPGSNKAELIDVSRGTEVDEHFITADVRVDSKERLWAYGAVGICKIDGPIASWKSSRADLYTAPGLAKKPKISDRRVEDIFELDGNIYMSAQLPEQIQVFNEELDTFELLASKEKVWGRRWFEIEDEIWLTSFFDGFMKLDTSTMTVEQKFARQNDKLPESWIRGFTLLGSDKILWRGEPEKWYVFNHRTGENNQLNQYQEYKYRLSSMEAIYNQNSQQLLPGTDCIYEYDINFVDEMERHGIIMDRLVVNKKDVSSRLPYRLSEIGSIELPHDENNLQIFFKDQIPQERNHLFYEFTLEGRDTKWRSNEDLRVSYPELAPGDYIFKARLTSKLNGESSEPVELKITILKPFYLTGGAVALYFFGFIFSIFSVTRARTRKLRKKQFELQKIIAEKTRDIQHQKDDLEEKQNEILDSIAYAKRIQSAILPQEDYWNKYLPSSFVLYLPKDIVAGDFYWLQKDSGKIYFAAADCTGHGVPGAMVSVVCNNSLNKAVSEYGLSTPGEILDKTREIVISEFEKSAEGVKDGMDIALCCLDGNKLSFAGAHNPLWLIRNGSDEIEEFKADKQPIGIHISTDPFTTHELEVNPGDTIYLFSDGFADQFGGEKGKKFKASNFKKLLLSIKDQPIETHHDVLEKAFHEWKGDLEQLDDLCVIGVRF